MSNPDPHSSTDHTDRQLLAEFIVPRMQGMETQVVDYIADHVAGTLRQSGIEPRQLDQILSAINQSLQDRAGDITPLRLRISVSGMALAEMPSEDSLAHQQDLEIAGRGFGFFLVKRNVGQLRAQDPEKYRLLEVLIYREGGWVNE